MAAFFLQLRQLTIRFLWALLFIEGTRLYFLFNNFSQFNNAKFYDIFLSFSHGIQFDYYSFVALGCPFVVLSLIPCSCFTKKYFQKILKVLFVLSVGIIILFNLIDSEYFKFTGKRSTFDFFSMVTTGDDTRNLLPQFIKDFWLTFVFFIFSMFLLIRYYPKFLYKSNIHYQPLINIPIAIVAILFIFLLARGFGLRPLTIVDAAESNQKTVPLTLNTTFTILQTITQDNLKPVQYFKDEKAFQLYNPIRKYSNSSPFSKKNIVIIILESFGKEYVGFYNNGKGYTPFLDSLLKHSLTFRYSLANGKKSVEGIPAIIASLPNLYDNSFIFSPYISNNFNTLASILGNEGYQTAFFHGGKNGTMGFDRFAKAAGFQNYYGKDEYSNTNDYDGNWGIYDEPYLQYIAKKLNSFSQPFFISAFTLSSHHPYNVPEKYKAIFPQGTLPIHPVIGYTDYALKRFFETAKKQSWFNNTLFVFVADHTSLSNNHYYQNPLGIFQITLAYFSPKDTLLQGYRNTVTQQIDIMPTILDYLHFDKPFFAFGKSILDKTDNHFAVTYFNNLYEKISTNQLIFFDGNTINAIYNLPEDSLLNHKIIPYKNYNIDTLKAFIQVYNNSLIQNNMLP